MIATFVAFGVLWAACTVIALRLKPPPTYVVSPELLAAAARMSASMRLLGQSADQAAVALRRFGDQMSTSMKEITWQR